MFPGPRRPPGGAGADDVLTAALVVPLQGPGGIFGPSCELSARLAAEEVNAAGGLLGRALRLLPVDGGRPPSTVAAEVAALVRTGAVDAVVGWHTSAVRRALAPAVAHHVPYVYTAQYEGGEHTPGVFLTGETDARQLGPAMRLLAATTGARRWCVVGNDYVWPRKTARSARSWVASCGGRLLGTAFVPLGTEDFTPVLRRIDRGGADAVVMLLVGADAVHFNRGFAALGLHERCLRLSTHMDENMLLGTGADATAGLWAAAGWFEGLGTAESMDFSRRYALRFGLDAPVVGSLGESCYEGVRLLAALVQRAGSADVRAINAVRGQVGYEGPRGALRLRGNHLDQRLYLARADSFDFHVVAQL